MHQVIMVPLGTLVLQCFGKANHSSLINNFANSVRVLVRHLLAQLRIILEFLLQGLIFALSASNLLAREWEFIWEFLTVSC